MGKPDILCQLGLNISERVMNYPASRGPSIFQDKSGRGKTSRLILEDRRASARRVVMNWTRKKLSNSLLFSPCNPRNRDELENV